MDSIRAVYMQEHATGGPTPLRGSAPSSERLLFAQSIRLIHFMSPLERKGHELEQQKRAQELAQLRKEIEEEEKRLKEFNDWLEDWERAERMRQFIAVYTEKSRSWPAEKQPKYREWIEWATREADRLDPFVLERPASVVDRKHELGRR